MGTEDHTLVILDIKPHIKRLVSASEHYAKPRVVTITRHYSEGGDGTHEIGLKEVKEQVDHIPTLSLVRARPVILAIIEDILTAYLRYKESTDVIREVAKAMFGEDSVYTDVQLAIAEDFLIDEQVDNIILDLHNQVGSHVRSNPWRQWDLIPGHVPALIGGKDYRIAQWEREHGHEYGIEDDEECRKDVSTLINYLQHQIVQLNQAAKNEIPVGPILVEALTRNLPHHRFQDPGPVPYIEVESYLGMSYEDFYRRYVRPVVEIFITTELNPGNNEYSYHRGVITDDYQLVFMKDSLTPPEEENRYIELKQCVDRGDWLPERDLRWLQAYEREHGM